MRASFLFAASVVCFAGTVSADVIIPNYTIQGLGTLGGASSTAYSVNNSGQVTGVSKTASGSEQAFLYNGSFMTALPTGGSAVMSSGAHINDRGENVGTTFFTGSTQGSYWSGSQSLLSNFGGSEGSAMSVNNAGQIVGSSQFSDGHAEAFVTSGNTMTALGLLAGGDWSSANDINNSGQVVGTASTKSGSFRAFTWTAGGQIQSLGTLGGSNSYAMSVSDKGVVAGNSQNALGWTHAFSYFNGSMYDLGTLGGNNSYGYGTNSSGDVVGYSETTSGSTHAFIYRNGALVDLNNLLPSNSGWTIEAAYDINDKGQIVGVGTNNGERLAFLLNPEAAHTSPPMMSGFSTFAGVATPEPETFLVAFVAISALLVSRMR